MNKIPAKIHFLFLNKHEKMNEVFETCYERVKEIHPDWDIKIYNEDDAQQILAEHFSELLPVYNSYTHVVQKGDFLRVLIVYLFGGFYMDLDMLCFKSLEELRDHELILSKEFLLSEDEQFRIEAKHKLRIANYMFGGKPGHPFLLTFLKEIVKKANTDVRYEKDIIKSTGPELITNVYHANKRKYKNITLLQNIDRQCMAGWHREIACHFGNFACHLHTGTWRWGGKKSNLPQKQLLIKDNYIKAATAIDQRLKKNTSSFENDILLLEAGKGKPDYSFAFKQLYEKLKVICKSVPTAKKLADKIVLSIGNPCNYKGKLSEANTNVLYTLPVGEKPEEDWIEAINNLYDYCIVPHEHIKKIFLRSGVEVPIQVIDLGFNRARRSFSNEEDDETTDFTLAVPYNGNDEELKMVIAACEILLEKHLPALKLKLIVDSGKINNKLFIKEQLKKNWITTVELSKALQKSAEGVHGYIFPDTELHWTFGPREILYEGTPCVITNHSFYKELLALNACCVINNKQLTIENIKNAILELFDHYPEYNENAVRASRWIEDRWTFEFTILEIFRFVNSCLAKNKTSVTKKTKHLQL